MLADRGYDVDSVLGRRGRRGRPVPGPGSPTVHPCASGPRVKERSPGAPKRTGYRCPKSSEMSFAITSTRRPHPAGGTVLLCDGKKSTVRALPDQARGHPEHAQFHWRKSVLNSVAVGVVAFGGVTGRSAAVDDMPFVEALRHAVPVGPVMAGLAFAISWLIPAFDRRFPRRTDAGARTDRST